MSQINVGFDNNSPQSIERAYGTLVQGRTTPYASVALANTAVIGAYRYRGKTVIIDDGTGAKEYWWRLDITDPSLVPKLNFGGNIDFVIGDGGGFTPAAGSTVYTNPAIKNGVVSTFLQEGAPLPSFPRLGSPSFAYDPVAGTITLTNTVFSLDAWYQIKFRQL